MRQLVTFSIKAAISALLIYFAIGSVNIGPLGERLNDLKVGWILNALVIAGVQIVLLSARWQQIARACDAPLSIGRAFRFNLIAVFFNQVLPSTAGGDAMRVWLFARDGAGWSKATYSVLLDRFVGILALAILVVVCLPWTLALIQNPAGRAALLLIGFGTIAGSFIFVGLSYLRWAWLEKWMPARHLTQLALIARKFLFSARTSAPVMALSLVIHVLAAMIAWCLAHAVDAPFGFVNALQLVPPVMLISVIPISVAGWGVRERSLVLAFAMANLSESDGFLVSVLFGTTMVIVGIVGGIVWLTSAERTERRKTLAG